MTWNPDADGVLGLQWPVTVESAYAVDSPTKAIGAAVEAGAATESSDRQSVYVAGVFGSARYVMEVRPVDATESPAVTTSTFRPDEDVMVTVSGETIKLQSGADATIGTAFPVIDEAVLDTADYLRTDTATTARHGWKGRFNIGSLAGLQVLSLTVSFVVQTSEATAGANFDIVLDIGGVEFLTIGLNALDELTTVSYTWDYNPATGLPWTAAEIEAFASTNEIGFYTYGTTTWFTKVYQGWVDVETVPEQRLAVGGLDISTTGWQEFDLSTPTGGGSWSKVLGTEYVTTVRRLYGTGSASFRYLDSLADAPNGHHGYAVQFSGAEGRLLELGAELTRAHALIITTSAPATSADSQPYALRSLAAVYTGHSAEQEFQGVAANYGVVKAVVAAQAGVPSADLNIKLRRRDNDVQIGTTMTVTPDELTGTVTTPREITARMAAAAVPATQMYFEFTSSAPDGEGWVVVLLDTTGTGSSASYGGTTDVATVGGVEDNGTDLAVVVAQIPTAPTNLAVTTEEAANGHEYLRLTWDQTGLSGDFGSYEIQRDDDGTWRQIAAISTESVEEFDDYESRRGIEASYRLRVVHTNGIPSDWTATVTGTAG